MREAVFIEQAWKLGKLVPGCDPIHLGSDFSVLPQIWYLSSGQKPQRLFSRAQFYRSPVSCLETSFVLVCIEFWPEKSSCTLCSEVLYSYHRGTTNLFKQKNVQKMLVFFQPHPLPQTVPDVFLCVWIAAKGGPFWAIFTIRTSKCLSHVLPQVCTAGNPIVTDIGI